MNRLPRILLWSIVFLVLVPGLALAQSGGPYDLSWSTIDGGGHTFSTDGSYELGGTAGQADAGLMSGGNYELSGGFWLCVTAEVAAAGIATSGATVTLTWTAGEPTANIYRGQDDPYFTLGAVYAGGVSSGWTDTGAAGNPAHNDTYVIRAQGGCGESADSRRLGEFDFALTPGS